MISGRRVGDVRATIIAQHAIRLRLALVAGLCLLFTGAGVVPVLADSAVSGGDVSVAQTLGDRELTVVLRRVTSVPGPLSVDVITHAGTAPGRLALAMTPTGTTTGAHASPVPGMPTSRADLDLGATPGTYSTALRVDRPGPWELSVSDGQRTARIPFVVPAQTTSPPERLVYDGFLAAGVLMLVTVVVAARAKHTGWSLVPAGGMLAGISVAVAGALLSASMPLPPQPYTQLDPSVDNVTNPYALHQPLISDYSRPPVMLTLDGTPLTAGRPADLGLNLSDGATGLPVDDLLVHDSALIHLLLIGPTGQMWHLHPIRTAPGRYQQHLTLPVPGHYALSAELVRRGGGVQLVRAAGGLDVVPSPDAAGAPAPGPPPPVRLGAGRNTGTTTVAGSTRVTVTTSAPVAGKPVTVTATVGDTPDLQPWLGMAGHMIVAGPLPPADTTDIGTAVQSAPVWAHAHSMGGPPPADSMGGMPMPGGSMAGTPGMPGTGGGSGPDGSMGGMPGMSMSGMGDGTDAMVGMTPVNGDSAPDETVAAYGPDVPFTATFPVAGQYRLWLQAERGYTVFTVPVVLDVAAAPSGQGAP
jgi:hypothetical protein